jgi:hypothetical protein
LSQYSDNLFPTRAIDKAFAMVVPVPMPEEEADSEQGRVEDEARLDGVRLAARTLEHHLTNHLTLTVGYAELIAEDPELPERLREMAQQVLQSAQAAIESVRRMRRIESVTLIDQGVPGGPLIELPRRAEW